MMRPALKSVGLILMLVCSTTIALCIPANLGRSPVLAQSPTMQDRKAEAERLFKQGNDQLNANQTDAALKSLEQALTIYREIKDRAGEGQALKSIGVAYLNLTQYEKAVSSFQQSLAIAREIKNQDLETRSLTNIGTAYLRLQKTEQAIASYRESLAIARSSQNWAVLEAATINLGDLYNKSQKYSEAIAVYQQAELLFREAKEKSKEAWMIALIGSTYFQQQQYEQAIEFYQKSQVLVREAQDKVREQSVVTGIGTAYFQQKKYEQAITAFQEARAIARELKNPDLEIGAFINLRSVYQNLGKPEKIIELLQQIPSNASENQRELLEASLLQHLMATYNSAQVNQPAKALEVAPRLIQLAQKLKKPLFEMIALTQSATAYAALGNDQQRIKMAQQVIEIAERSPEASGSQLNKQWGLNEIGNAYNSLKDYAKAIAAYQQALDFAKKSSDETQQINSLSALSLNHSLLGNYQKASEAAQEITLIARRQIKKTDQLRILQQSILNQEQIAVTALAKQDYAQGVEQDEQLLKLLTEASEIAKDLPQDPKTTKKLRTTFVNSYVRLSQNHANLGEIDKALNYAQKATDMVKQAQDLPLEIDVLTALPQTYILAGDFSKGIELVKKAIEISRTIKNPVAETMSLAQLADLYQTTGQTSTALIIVKQALSLSDALDPKKHSAYIGNSSYRAEDTLSQSQVALPARFKTDYKTEQEAANREFILSIRFQIRTILVQNYQYTGKFDQALETAQQSLSLLRASSSLSLPSSEVDALLQIGEVYKQTGAFQKAIDSERQALEIAKKIKDAAQEVTALIALSWTYQLEGKDAEALDVGQQALATAQRNKNAGSELEALDGLVAIYGKQQNLGKVLAIQRQAMDAAQRAKSPVVLLLGRSRSLADTYLSLGDYKTSRQLVNQLLAQSQRLKLLTYQVIAWSYLSYVAFSESHPQEMLEAAQQAAKIAQQLDSPDIKAGVAHTLSMAYGELGDYVKAVDAAQLRLVIARQLQDVELEKDALQVLGDLYRRLGKPQEAMKNLQTALTLQSPGRKGGGNEYVYLGLARIYALQKQPATAITFYKQAINSIEDTRRTIKSLDPKLQQSFLQTTIDLGGGKRADIYRQLADLLISQGRIAEAQQVLELLKIQELNDFTRGTRAAEKLSDIASNDVERRILKQHGTLIAFGQTLQQCLDTNCAQKAQLLQQRTALVNQYNQAVQQIETQSRNSSAQDFEYLQPNSEFSTTAQNIIDKQREKGIGTALLYPLVLDNKLWIVLVTEGGVLKRYEVAVSQKDLGDTVVAFQQQLRSPQSDIKQLQATSQKLYNWIIPKALKTQLNATDKAGKRKVQHLVFALDRATRYIPMSALFDGKQYLVENYAISTITAASRTDWIQGLPSNPQQAPALALGVSEAKGDFAALPNVPNELDAIVQKDKTDPYGSYPGSELLNGAFTFESLSNNLAGHRIVHIATHGQFVPGRANDSYLLLGNGKALTIPEINTLQELRKVDLVVLSACKTALGGTGNDGIEINGISSYFLSKGAKAVMASLWLVNDASTSLLMQQFYKNLATGKLTKAEALRQTQLSLLQRNLTAKEALQQRATLVVKGAPPSHRSQTGDFSHPYYWAPFILIGNGL